MELASKITSCSAPTSGLAGAALILLVAAARLPAAEFSSGSIVGWGEDIAGQSTGVPVVGFSTGVVAVAGRPLTDVVGVSAGRNHGLAVRASGTVAGWGFNGDGQATGGKAPEIYTGNGTVEIGGRPLTNVAAVAAGAMHSLALTRDGLVVAWGDAADGKTSVPPGLSGVTQLAAGDNYSLALRRDGTVVGWGKRRVPTGLTNVVAIAAGRGWGAFSLALLKDGTVVGWRPGSEFEAGRVLQSNAVAVAAGDGHWLALRRDGSVFGWGDNNIGQATGEPTPEAPYHSQGSVALRGKELTGVVAVAAGGEQSLALCSDGTVVAWGYCGHRPATSPAWLTNVVAIAAGESFCLAITTNHFAAFPPKAEPRMGTTGKR